MIAQKWYRLHKGLGIHCFSRTEQDRGRFVASRDEQVPPPLPPLMRLAIPPTGTTPCSSFCVDCCIDCITVEKQRYMSFYNLVNHHAPWDIKEEASWKTTIGTEFPGYNVQVKYCGMLMTPEALGNYTYGYLGRAYGIPLDFLCTGSWYAAGFPTSRSAPENERIDQEYIKFGYFCYYTPAID